MKRSASAAAFAALAMMAVAVGCTPTPTPPPATKALQVTASGYSTCARLETGDVRCWGQNDAGTVGNGSDGFERPPTTARMTGATDLTQNAARQCSVLTDGTVRCWGGSYVGNGTSGIQELPQTVTGLTGVAKVRSLGDHTCAVLTSGGVKCWGLNNDRQLGDGTTTTRLTPVTVTGLTGAVDVVRAGGGTCALRSDHSVKCWSYHLFRTSSGPLTLATVPALAGATALSGSDNKLCAIVTGGAVKCWGSGVLLGNGTNVPATQPATGVTATGVTGATAINAENASTVCAIVAGGAVKCWGDNSFGQIRASGGALGGDPVPLPTAVPGVSGATSIGAGGDHTCATVTDGRVLCWGSNEQSQLGRVSSGPGVGAVQNLTAPNPFTNTSTAWPAIGTCFKGYGTGTTDIKVVGPPSTLDDVAYFSSSNGTCSGAEVGRFTIVQATMQHLALPICTALDPMQFNAASWEPYSVNTFPQNAFNCWTNFDL